MPRGKGNSTRNYALSALADQVTRQTARIIAQAQQLDKTKAYKSLLTDLVKALQPVMPVTLEDNATLHVPLSVHGSDVFVAFTAAKLALDKDFTRLTSHLHSGCPVCKAIADGQKLRGVK